MSRTGPRRRNKIGDLLALRLQELQSERRLRGDQPLLRIDNREEAGRAPFQFDTAQGRLHRAGCRAIPESSRTALYGVWEFGPEEQELACPRCKPVPRKSKPADKTYAVDLLYGFFSILDQFGDVLRERGREYRKSRNGQQLSADLDGLTSGPDGEGGQMLDALASSLDGIVKTIRTLDDRLAENGGRNGSRPSGSAAARSRAAEGEPDAEDDT